MATEPIFGIPQGVSSYPSTGSLIFGSDYGNQDFVVPMAKFTFFDAKGLPLSGSSAPVIYVRLGGAFNSTLTNGYQEAQGIMGDPSGTSIFESDTGKALGRLGSSFIEGIQKQIVQGVAGATGYVASAGQSGKTQVEFLQRVMLNNFQQLIYQGPTFRRFQLPFIMKPHSQSEAETMLGIISSFRVASSPRTGTEPGTLDNTIDTLGRRGDPDSLLRTGDAERPDPTSKEFPDGEESQLYQDALRDFLNMRAVLTSEDEAVADTIVKNSGQVFTFGYPDMCKFDLILYKKGDPTGVGDDLIPLFKSEFCMIETVSVDYGSQNKMTFFDGKNNNTQYFPTDVNLTISLRESVLITAFKASEQYISGTVLL
jgi:hypothetical protein